MLRILLTIEGDHQIFNNFVENLIGKIIINPQINLLVKFSILNNNSILLRLSIPFDGFPFKIKRANFESQYPSLQVKSNLIL